MVISKNLLLELKRIMKEYDFKPKKRFGQNFLVNLKVIESMIDYASITPKDVVLDAGAGVGFITEQLATKCSKVIAVELDKRLTRILMDRLKHLSNVEIIEGDILKIKIPNFNKVVSTPPYYISSQFLFWLLDRKFDCAVLTFQKEFAERLTAEVGSENYGRLTITAYYKAEVETLDFVSKRAFYPQPDVDSIITRLKPRRKPPFEVENERLFFEIVKILFSHRNKLVRRVLFHYLKSLGFSDEKIKSFLSSLSYANVRIRSLDPKHVAEISNILHEFLSAEIS